MNKSNRIKNLFFLTLSIFIIGACAPNPCTKEGVAALDAARNADLQGVKDYLENGGDPMYSCGTSKSGTFIDASGRGLDIEVTYSESYELIEYYLTYDIPDEVKANMLSVYASYEESDKLTRLLLKNGAHYTNSSCYAKDGVLRLENLKRCNYDFNWINPEDGNNLFMDYAGCPAPDGATEIIEILQFLVDEGVKTKLKNKEGKTALDMAVNAEIKAYIKSL